MKYLVEMEVLKKQSVVVVLDEELISSEKEIEQLAIDRSEKLSESAFVTKEKLWVMRSSKLLPMNISSNQIMLLECGYPYEMIMNMDAEDTEAELDAVSRT
ncbi:hypothetical protein [Terribacillus sp. 7520-G]|uniref:hypothetical protein n=1 Tax=Terribacillus TaxID=459532 RepID=UPI000BA55716|nr:hypothetical protein [Terribacillus sp. 7520-G]PAD38642.1 hypothetical protein CHH53_10460 [Terribacillus sp. 7520-G]